MFELDHIAVAAETLAEGVAAVEAALGVELAAGGQHDRMGTHNRLLSLGEGVYLEVIAINSEAPAPDHPRWFDLDRFAGAPRLSNWIVRCDDLERELAASVDGAGRALAFQRGDLQWSMGVPTDGVLPFDGAHPALIEWHAGRHPSVVLPDVGCRLVSLEVIHPEAAAVRAALSGRLADPRVTIVAGAEPAFRAEIQTPKGLCVLT
jgi:hypothetical protein